MSRSHGKIICHNCNDKAHFIEERPNKVPVQIPHDPRIETISEALDYAARVYLRLRDMHILFPMTTADDDYWAQLIYKHLSKLTLHTEEQIKTFESAHLSSPDKKIKTILKSSFISQGRRTTEAAGDDYQPTNKLQKKERIHIKLPKDSGGMTKTGVANLYIAITCKVIGDISRGNPHEIPEDSKEYANAIYSIFRLLLVDTRYSHTTMKWLLEMFPEISDNSGYNAVASKNSLSSKHVRNNSRKLNQRIQDMVNSRALEYFDSFIKGFAFIMRHNPDVKEYFHKRFQSYELEALNGVFLTKYNYYVAHNAHSNQDYDNYKHTKSTRKRCPIKNYRDLSNVKIDDEGYSDYESLINDMISEGNMERARAIYSSAQNVLHGLGWTESFIDDKIHADLLQIFTQRGTNLNNKIESYKNKKAKV